MKRLRLTVFLASVLVMSCALSAWGQVRPWPIDVDSSFRVGWLFGQQMVRYADPLGAAGDRVKSELSPKVPILSGAIELTPFYRISGRVAGSLSVLEPHIRFYAGKADPSFDRWDVRPNFKQWEAAGLVHLWKSRGYRFSVVAGYRQEYWTYTGDPVEDAGTESWLNDRWTSHIPFMALQTSLFFPWWKTRFEVLGSPFMTKKVLAQVRNGSDFIEYDGSAPSGGLLEFTVEGTAAVTSLARLGLYGKYTHQELHGNATREQGSSKLEKDLFVQESFGVIGVNFMFVF